MTRSEDPIRDLVEAWAASESGRQVTRLSPALIRAKHLLAREDRRRRRARRAQAAVVALPIALLVAALRPWESLPLLAGHLAAPLPSTLVSVAGMLCLVAGVGATWATE